MESIQRFYRHASLSYKALNGTMDAKTYFLFMVFSPVMQMLFWGFLVRFIYNGEDLAGYVASNALLLSVFSAVFGMMTVVMSDRSSGTLPIVIASPINKAVLFVARTIPHIVNGFITSVIGFFIGIFVFDLAISVAQFGVLMLIWIVSIFAACTLGLILGSASLWTPSMHMLSNFLSSLLLLLSGASYSLSILPNYLQTLAHWFPLMRGVELTKQLLNENNTSNLIMLLGQEFLLGFAYLIIGLISIYFAERLARKTGTLELN